MHDDHTACAVRREDDRSLDLRERLIEHGDPRSAGKLVALHARNGRRLWQLLFEQGLPMLRHVVAQARNDQDCRGSSLAQARCSVQWSELVVGDGEQARRSGKDGIAQPRRVRQAVLGEVPRRGDFRAQKVGIALPRARP